MELNKLAIEEFKDYVIQSMNEDVYSQLKSWIGEQIDDPDDYSKAIEFFIENLHGSLAWID